jgi:hypothetical protein
MNPFGHSLVDPFGGLGVPGDPMEQVLSLQSYDAASDVAAPACSVTSACRTCTCATNSCDTSGCTFSCAVGPGGGTLADSVDGW